VLLYILLAATILHFGLLSLRRSSRPLGCIETRQAARRRQNQLRKPLASLRQAQYKGLDMALRAYSTGARYSTNDCFTSILLASGDQDGRVPKILKRYACPYAP